MPDRHWSLCKQARKERSCKKIDAALALDSQSARNYAIKGKILRKQGKSNQALPLLNKAIELKPKGAKLYMERASIFTDLKRRDAAIEDLTHACNLGNTTACQRKSNFKSAL